MSKTRRNDPESNNLTPEEAILFEAARGAVALLKKTFETWVVIGRAVHAARVRADRIGGGKTFRRILTQQGLVTIVPPATATRLLLIIEHLGAVSTWHAHLPEKRQFEWASPSTVFKHCPALQKAAMGAAANKPRKPSKPSKPAGHVAAERAIDMIGDYLAGLEDAGERATYAERLVSMVGGAASAEPAAALTVEQHFAALIDLLIDESPDDAQSALNGFCRRFEAAYSARHRKGVPSRKPRRPGAVAGGLLQVEDELNAALGGLYAPKAKPRGRGKKAKQVGFIPGIGSVVMEE